MKPIPEWRRVLRHAWSVRLAGIAFGCQIAAAVLPYFQDFVPPGLFALLSALATAGAIIARFVPQKKVSDE